MSAVAHHLLSEVLSEFKKNGGSNRPIAESFNRQQMQILIWLEDQVENTGVEATVGFLNNALEMNKHYEGVYPIFSDLVALSNGFQEKGINKDSPEFRAGVKDVGENGLLNTFDMVEGIPVERENRDFRPEAQQEVHPLKEAWDIQVENHKQAVIDGDEMRQRAAERVLSSLREQIGQDPMTRSKDEPQPKAEPKPEPKPKPEVDHSNDPDYEPGYVPPDEDDVIDSFEDRNPDYNSPMQADESTHISPDGTEVFDDEFTIK